VKLPTYVGNLLFAIAAAALLASTGVAQADRQIEEIRAKVSLINKNAAKYRRVNRAVENLSLEGAEAVYFISGRKVKKITAKIYGETFRATVELYYSDAGIIFGYRRTQHYDTHIAADPPPKVASVTEARVYYSGSKAVRVIDGKKRISATDTKFRTAEEEVTDLSDKLRAELAR